MNAGLASSAHGLTREVGDRHDVPLELVLVAMAVVCATLGALTNVVACAAVTSVVATLLTLRRMRHEVRQLREWEGPAARDVRDAEGRDPT